MGVKSTQRGGAGAGRGDDPHGHTTTCKDCGTSTIKKNAETLRSRNPETGEPGTGPAFHVCPECYADRESVAKTDNIAFNQLARGF